MRVVVLRLLELVREYDLEYKMVLNLEFMFLRYFGD